LAAGFAGAAFLAGAAFFTGAAFFAAPAFRVREPLPDVRVAMRPRLPV